MRRIGIVQFLGTNCDRDIWKAVKASGHIPRWLWYQDQFQTHDVDAVIIPGGFSFGDYLRAGALAARSPVMKSVREVALKGWPILGICNGFQILCEAGLLPGTLLKNEKARFIDKWVELNLVSHKSLWGKKNKVSHARLPIAHGMGRYYASAEDIKKLRDKDQIWWTYSSNPNGSLEDIAGITNEKGNVSALMPHPERALWDWMGSSDGLHFFEV